MCGASQAEELGDFRATSLSTLTQMLTTSGALTLLPESTLAVEMRGRRDLVARPFRKPPPHRTIGLAWRRSSPRAKEFAMLGESLVR